jgi:hypothetical protein
MTLGGEDRTEGASTLLYIPLAEQKEAHGAEENYENEWEDHKQRKK